MNAARIRIGRIKLKRGGAEVRVLNRRVDGLLITHLREALITVMGLNHPPDAYFLVTIRFDPESPGRPDYDVQFCSTHDGLPMAHLAEVGAAILKSETISWRSEVRTLRTLGMEPEDWDPEAA